MKFKRFTALLLCTVMMFAAAAAVTAAKAAGRYDYKLYDPALDSQKNADMVASDSIYGLRVKLNGDIVAAGFCMPTWNRTDCSGTIGVFAWKEDYDKTVAEEPLYERHIEALRDCATNELKFDSPLPAGEYFFAIYDTDGSVGIWRYPMTKSKGFAYMDGAETQCDLEITVYFTKKPGDEPVSPCESLLQVDGTHTPPKQYVIPDDDILYTRNAMPGTWVATDGLGRTLPTNKDVGDIRKDKYVGLFYWSWHESNGGNNPFNVSEFVEQYPESINDYNFSKWPKTGTAYFWNEPVYGYYRTVDRWVIRRHAELLAAANVDVIFFDNTNGTFTWRSSYRVIFDVFDKARKDGVKTPAISFLLPFDAHGTNIKTQLELLYMDIYRPGKYQDLWFYWGGKPMVMGGNASLDSSNLDKEIRKFFTFRAGQPAYDIGDGTTKQWGWLSRNPQARYYASTTDKNKGVIEEISVGVAQNSSTEIICTAMNGKNIFGRSYTHKDGFKHYEEENHSLYGYNFAEQWEYAIEQDPKIIFVTGWNEWTAGRYEEWGGVENAFPDEFNDEYSRDIEPSKGKLKDHYYYQFVSYVRKFKGAEPMPEASAEKTIDIAKDASQWDDVGPYYIAYPGNTFDRKAVGYGSKTYTDESGNNDIKGARMARDGENIYVLAECENDISAVTDGSWMNVYLDTADGGLDGWESFDYVIKNAKDGKADLLRFTGSGYETVKAGECEYNAEGKTVQFKIKKSDLGISGGSFTVNFKITDNVEPDGDILNFYTTGDVAPCGRFKYSYTAAGSGDAQETTADTTASDTTDAVTENGETTSEEVPGTESAAESTEQVSGGGKTNVPLIIGIVCAAVAVVAVVIVIITRKKK